MKNIGAEWRNLADGFLRVETLEAQFRAEWGPRLERARREKAEAERQEYRRQGRAALLVAFVLALLLLTAALVLRSSPAGTIVLVLALVVPAVLALGELGLLFRTPDPLPDPSDLFGRWLGTVSGVPRRYGALGRSCRRGTTAMSARSHSFPTSPVVCPRSTWR
jgi:hypothetical protein